MVKKIFRLFFLVTFAIVIISSGPCAMAQEQLPHIVSGTLSNYLSYHIASTPEWRGQRAEIRLVLPIGSLVQDASEGGIAHFIEHMAFAGTQKFPKREVTRFIERHGGVFGYQINAQTGFDRTIYSLSIPANPTLVDTAMMIVSEWLHHLSFDEDMIEEEREIIKQEIKQYQLDDPFQEYKLGIGPHLSKIPIGTLSEVEQINQSSLQAFYDKWYRPEYATVIATGDIDIERALICIEKHLNKDKGSKSISVQSKVEISHPSAKVVQIIDEAISANNKLEIIWPYSSEQIDPNLASTVEQFLRQLIDGSVSSYHYLGANYHFALSFENKSEEKLKEQVHKAMVTIKSIVRYGFPLSPSTIDDFRSLQYDLAPRRIASLGTPHSWAERWVDFTLDKEPIYDNVSSYHEANSSWIDSITPSTLVTILQQITKQSNGLLILYKRGKNGSMQKDDLLDLVKNTDAHKLNLPEIQFKKEKSTDKRAALPSLQLQGEVVQPIEIKKTTSYGIYIASFPNGSRLIMKPTSDGSRLVNLTHIGKGGYRLLPDSIASLSDGADAYVDMGNVGEFTPEEWSDLAINNEVFLGSSISDNKQILYGRSPTDALEMLFYAIHRRVSSPHVPQDALEEGTGESLEASDEESILDRMLKSMPSYPVSLFLQQLLGHNPAREHNIKKSDVSHLSADQLEYAYKSIFENVTGSTTIVTGDFEVEEILRLFGLSFGSFLPPESIKVTEESFLPTPPVTQLTNNTNMIVQHHIIWGEYTTSWKNSLRLKTIQELMRRKMLQSLREQSGLVYSPQISLKYDEISDGTSRFVLHIENTIAVEDSIKVSSIVGKMTDEFDDWVRTSTQKIEEIKQLFRTNKNAALISATAWHETLVDLVLRGESVEDFDSYDTQLSSITADELAEFWRDIKVKHITVETEL